MSICISADKILYDFLLSQTDVETAFNRVPNQAVKCGFGMQGVCCRLCSNGPCRITPDSPRGVCGASPDTMVARNFLRAVAAGAACYLHIVENAAVSLREIGRGKIKRSLSLAGYTARAKFWSLPGHRPPGGNGGRYRRGAGR